MAVASNFADTLERLAAAFESSSGHRVLASAGSTGKLYAQITNGAPFEVFLAADTLRPRLLEQRGAAVAGSRMTYAVGRLVLWSAQTDLVDGRGAILGTGQFRHLALANPDTAPYGAAARQVLEHMNLWRDLSPRLVRGENITQAFHFVATGNAELGFVALSQTSRLDAANRGSGWLVPAELHAPIEQQVVLLEAGRDNPAALQFLDFLRTPAACAVIRRAGYGAG